MADEKKECEECGETEDICVVEYRILACQKCRDKIIPPSFRSD
jgi:hypothetical protein